MIKSINIKNVATFDSVDGIQITDLKKVNFIYGANGSGKTTISNFLQNSGDTKFNDCQVNWDNSEELTTLVYNKDFRESNFGKGRLNGVFTLGQATKEEKKTIEDKTEQLNQIKTDCTGIRNLLNKKKEKKKTLEKEFTEFAWENICKKFKDVFKESFTGSMGSAKAFKIKILQEFVKNKESLQSYDDLKEQAITIFGETPTKIESLNNIEYTRISEIEKASIWGKIVAGKADVDIAKLIQKLNINDWVNQGRSYIQEDNICPFCQQPTIDINFKTQIEKFFDQSYIDEVNSFEKSKEEYHLLFENIINELNSIESTQKGFNGSKLNIDKFASYLKTLISQNTTCWSSGA